MAQRTRLSEEHQAAVQGKPGDPAAVAAILGQGPHLPAGTTQITINPPSTGEDFDSDDDSDDDDQWLYLADPTQLEVTAKDGSSTALICLAMTPNHKEVTLWSQSGRLSSDMASRAMELCRDGCRTMHKLMKSSSISSESFASDNITQ